MSNTSTSTSSSLGCTTVLFMIFLVLKLIHVIAWSWWWVSAPLWIPVIGLLLFCAFCYGMAKLAGQR